MARHEDRWGLPADRSRPAPYSERRSREHSPPHPSRPLPHRDDRDRRQHARHSYDAHPPRYSYASPGYPAPGRRQSWPPSPLVEEEKTSLAKEANPFKVEHDDVDPRTRGSLDQTPIILEVDPPAPAEPNMKKQRSISFTRGAKGARRNSNSASAKPEKKGRANAPRFSGEFPGAPELSSRSPSTYAFTPKARTPDAREEFRSSHDSGYFSTSDARASVSSDKRRDAFARGVTEAVVTDALRGQGKSRESSSHHQRKPSGPGSVAGSDISSASSKASTGNRPRLSELKKEALLSHRRSSDSATTLPQPELAQVPHSRNNGSRPTSPAHSPVTRFPPSPPRSPRHSPNQSREDLLSKSGRSSGQSSGTGSRGGSRPSSPKHFDHPAYPDPLRRSGTIPSIPDDKTQRTSRLASSELVHDDPRTPKVAPMNASALPYPVDDMNLMPSEEDHRYKPRGLGIEETAAPSIPGHRAPDKKSVALEHPKDDHLHRPILNSRHTYAGEAPALPQLATAAAALTSPTATESPWSSGRGPRPPPPCPRPFATRGHDDWLTLENMPKFDICPSCYDANFAHGPFYQSFKRVHHDPKEKLRCDFASPWVRLAWLLTLKQHRYDLELVYAVARAGSKDPCPGDHDESRLWYTVKDGYGEKVEKFDVCLTDVKRVEALLPSMQGLFTRAYHGSAKKRKCDFRVESKRFQEYLDTLIEIEDVAHTRRRAPDVGRFGDVARQKAQMRECSRDDLVLDMAWHYPPQLPELTVCEECYSEVVWPAIADGSSVAGRFHRTPQLVHGERRNSANSIGTSCQLYSPRMRRVFKKSVQSSDFPYLARRVQERKDVELALHERYASIRRSGPDLGSQGSKQGAGAPTLKQEMERLAEEWRQFE